MKLFEFSFNPLLVLMSITGMLTFLIILKEFYCYIRRTLRRSVQCWFCHNKTKISYEEFNNWTCRKCDQYNGFSKDGGYNKILYNQFDSRLNPPVFGRACSRRPLNKNVLCYRCNTNQQLKIQQLALFEPLLENNYDTEVEHFRKQVEKTFKLCLECEVLVSRVNKQLREELSAPKRLRADTARAKVELSGEWCQWMNVAVSLLVLAIGASQGSPLSSLWTDRFSSFLPSHTLQLKVHPLIGTILLATTCLSLLQNRSFCTAAISALLFFTSLYPDFHHLASHIQTVGGLVSLLVSAVCMYRNRRRRRVWTTPSLPSPELLARSPNLAKTQRSTQTQKRSRPEGCSPPLAESGPARSSLHKGLDSLQIGSRARPLVAPPRFNPFSSGGRSSYAASVPPFDTPPSSSYEGYEPPSPHHYTPTPSPPPSCYPCAAAAAASWSYCLTAPYSRISPPVSPPCDRSQCQQKNRDPISLLIGIPMMFLVLCNLALMNIVYNTKFSTNS